jgi:Domain of unknown function (DUF4129)
LRPVELIRATRVGAGAAIFAAAIFAAMVIAAPQPEPSGAPGSPAPVSGVPASGAPLSGVPSDGFPADTLRACAAKRQPAARGLDALTAQCPELKAALAGLGYFETLPSGWQGALTPGQLEDLAALASRYRGEPPSAAPDVSAVGGIVAGLAKENASAPKSWWDLVRDWVRSLFAGHDENDPSWIERLMNKLSSAAGVLTALTYALVALIIGGALIYLIIEMRSSGLFARAARSRKASNAARFAGDVSMEQLARAAIFDQPALLLGLLVQRLKRAGRLSAERHLTHRELTRAATLDDPAQRGRLGRLTQVAEELLYGARPPPVELVHRAIEEGHELLRQFDGPRETVP